MNQQYLVIVERAPHNFAAYAPDLPGCVATGSTKEETLTNMRIDEPESTYIIAVVDLDDPDEMMDLIIIDRLIELQVEHNIPISVIPTRMPERVALLERRQGHYHSPAALLPPAPV